VEGDVLPVSKLGKEVLESAMGTISLAKAEAYQPYGWVETHGPGIICSVAC
jgi:hypothetical protein